MPLKVLKLLRNNIKKQTSTGTKLQTNKARLLQVIIENDISVKYVSQPALC